MNDADIYDAQQIIQDIANNVEQLSEYLANLENYTRSTNALMLEGATRMPECSMRICIDYNDNGTPIIKQVRANNQLELADKVVKAMLSSPRRSEFVPVDPVTVVSIPHKQKVTPTLNEYATTWYKTYKVGNVKENTLEMYKSTMKYFEDTLGTYHMDEITTSMIQSFMNDFAVRGDGEQRARSTCTKCLLTLKQIFDAAVADKLLTENPVKSPLLKNPSKAEEKREALSDADYFDILANLDKLKPMDKVMLALMAYTGMRRGEVLGLRWSNVDFKNGLIHVKENVVFPSGVNNPCITTPKSKSSVRDLGITLPLEKILLDAPKTGEYVCGGGNFPMTNSSFKKAMMRIGKTIDLHGATPHIFRHTYGTYLSYHGVGAVDLTSIMGHEDVSTTMKYYVHVKTDSARNAEKNVAQSLMDGIANIRQNSAAC